MDILFWSGGKDAYLALHFYRKSHPDAQISLLTTYNEKTDTVPHQNIPLSQIREQAEYLNLNLITVPLPPECSNKVYLQRIKEKITGLDEPIEHLIFGDWHLQDIRDWREKVFGNMGYSCLFPIWQKDLQELISTLLLQPVEIKISAVSEEYDSILKVGESYDQKLITQLHHLNDIDPMGENGEFHTKVTFPNRKSPSNQFLIPPN